MQRFCHNCGDPVDEDEIFCDNCGTKILQEENVNTNQNTNNSQQYNQSSQQYNQTNQNNVNQNHQNYQQVPYNQMRKPSKTNSVAIIASVIAFIAVATVVGLIVIPKYFPDMFKKENKSTTVTNDSKNYTNNTNNTNNGSNNNTNNTNNNSNKTVSDVALAIWSANLNANTLYLEAERKIDIDYSIALTNEGFGNASNIKIYFNPEKDDENANYLRMTTKTIVNANEDISSFNMGETREIKAKFYYSDVDASYITQEYLQNIANAFVKLPVLIEWEENGKVYSQSLVIK